ncbi:MAG: LacI family DNA-binding transcriptional regulator [Armatimonadota bacterium]
MNTRISHRDKTVTMLDVAQVAGVSKATVSKVLNRKPGVSAATHENILRICNELNYSMNPNIQDFIRKTVGGSTKNIAFVLGRTDFADPAYSRFIDGIARGAEESNYHVVFAKLTGQEQSIFDLPMIIRDHRVDGILLSGRIEAQTVRLIRELEIPYVMLGTYNNSIARDSLRVELDLGMGLHKIVETLKSLGRTRIGFFSECLDSYGEEQLFLAYQNALKDNGLEFFENLVYIGNGRFTGAIERFKEIFELAELPFDALFSIDFRTASEISHMIWGHYGPGGSRDVILATGRPYYYFKLPLFAVYLDPMNEDMAYQGFNLLLKRIVRAEDLVTTKILLSPTVEAIG